MRHSAAFARRQRDPPTRVSIVRWVRSGAAVLSSIPRALLALGVLLALAIVRFASLRLAVKRRLEADKRKTKEAPMWNDTRSTACSSLIETVWTLGVSMASGVALLS